VGVHPGPKSGSGLPNGTFSDVPADKGEVVGSNTSSLTFGQLCDGSRITVDTVTEVLDL